MRLLPAVLLLGLSLAATERTTRPLMAGQSDLDAFMQQVLARRDDNWRKLQQYVLDERETIDLRGPGHTALWSEHRDYTWFIRDGYFVRSPLKFNGVTIGEADRRKFEADFLRRVQEREKRRRNGQPTDAGSAETPAGAAGTPDLPPADAAPPAVDSLLRQTRQPQFISSAYFLRFRFEAGKYALVGREPLDGRDVLRIEYYPSNLFSNEQRRRMASDHNPRDPRDAEMQRLMNKTSLVTLWIEPASHQIVKYTFDNVALDFLPAQWLLRLDEVRATMTMGQPFPDVWLPRDLSMHVVMTLAAGQFDVQYGLAYHEYRRADVTTKVTIPGER